jgi:hypothetical protein
MANNHEGAIKGEMMWACVWERVRGLARGKAAGSVFLSLPMVNVKSGDSRVFEVPLPPKQL